MREKIVELGNATELGCWCASNLCRGHAILRVPQIYARIRPGRDQAENQGGTIAEQIKELWLECEKDVKVPISIPDDRIESAVTDRKLSYLNGSARMVIEVDRPDDQFEMMAATGMAGQYCV